MTTLKHTAAIWLLAIFCSQVFAAEQVIPAWSYYKNPPFVTAEQQGLTYDFIELLNKYSQGKYHFDLGLLPRTRIDKHLANKDIGIVLFVNWLWMGDKQKTKYLWSPPLD